MEQVLIVIGDASEVLDTMYPYYRLQEEGFRPVVTAPERRRYQLVLHETKPGWTITKEWEGYTLMCDVPFKEVIEEDYLGIFFSGGRSARIPAIRSGFGSNHSAFFCRQQADRQCLPRSRDPGLRRLRSRASHGDRAEMSIRLGSLRWCLC